MALASEVSTQHDPHFENRKYGLNLTLYLCALAEKMVKAGRASEEIHQIIQSQNAEKAGSLLIPPISEDNLEAIMELAQERVAMGTWGGDEPGNYDPVLDTWIPLPFYQEKPPRTYVIEEILYIPSVSLWVGPSGSLKSMALMDAAVCQVLGKPWLQGGPDTDIPGFATERSPAIWYNGDNPTDDVAERLDAIGRAYGLEAGALLHVFSYPDPPLNAKSPASLEMLANRIAYHGVKTVYIDNLQTIKGNADENSASEMGPVISGLRRISEDCQCAIAIIHHVSKATGTYRGSSAIENLIDFALTVERQPGSNRIIFRPGKTRRAAIPPFGARFVYEHKPGLKELHLARFYGVSLQGVSENMEIAQSILEAISAHPNMGRRELADAVKAQNKAFGRDKVLRILDGEIVKGTITETRGSRNTKCLKLA